MLPELYTPVIGEGQSVYAAEIGHGASSVLESLLERLFNGERLTSDNRLLRATARDYTEALQRGYGGKLTDIDWNTPDFETLEKLTQNVYQFAAAKNYHELRDLTDAIRDGDKIRTFEEFQEAALPIIGKYNQNWLRTEYNQAVAAAQSGARWNDFQRGKKEMPYLQYQCIMDGNTRPEHARLHGVIKRMDDGFWDEYMPPNGWGCRCEAIQLPGSSYEETPNNKIVFPSVPEMFKINFGKQAIAFPQGHPYYRRLPKDFKRQAKDMARAEVRRVIANAEQYKALKEDPNYTEVRFDNYTGGVSAVHIEHHFEQQVGRFGIPRGDYERNVVTALYREGHSIVLRSEMGDAGIKQPDGFIDGILMDIKGVEGNCLYSMNRANVQKVNTAILYFHKEAEFSIDVVKDKWKELPSWIAQNERITDKTVYLKRVMCVVNGDSGYKVYEIKNPE